MTNTYYGRALVYGGALVDRCMDLIVNYWQEGMTGAELYNHVMLSGGDHTRTASTLKHFIRELFSARFLSPDALRFTTMLHNEGYRLPNNLITECCLLLTARAEQMLRDFLVMEYWPRIKSDGAEKTVIGPDLMKAFLVVAMQEGRGGGKWTEARMNRLYSSLSGVLTGFSLLERRTYRVTPPVMSSSAALFLLYDLMEAGFSHAEILHHPDWAVFGLDADSVLRLISTPFFRDYLLADVSKGEVKLSWRYPSLTEAAHHV